MRYTANGLKNKIIKLGGKEWNKDDMNRVYITNEILNVLLADSTLQRMEKTRGGVTQWGRAVKFGERNNKIFFDVKKNAVMRSYKRNKPLVEIQYEVAW